MSDAAHPPGTLVKICGLREMASVNAAVEAGADFIGVVFAESPRRATLAQARAIRSRLGPRVEVLDATAEAVTAARRSAGQPLLVGVFADQPPEEMNRIAQAADLDLVQLSGGEDPVLVARLVRPALRAVHVGADDTPERVLARARAARAILLLDTRDAARRGGTGRTFDWRIATAVARQAPLMLAGGLTPATVGDAVRTVRPWAVDVSSGVETDGAKDVAKIRAFIDAVRTVAGATP